MGLVLTSTTAEALARILGRRIDRLEAAIHTALAELDDGPVYAILLEALDDPAHPAGHTPD